MEAIALDVAGARAAGSVCAEASVVAANNEAATRTGKASLERMEISWINQMMQRQELARPSCVPSCTNQPPLRRTLRGVIQIKTSSTAMDETSRFR
jgi:hypothetical protein